MKNIKNWIVIGIIAILIILGGGYFLNQSNSSSESSGESTATETDKKAQFKASLKVNDGVEPVIYDLIDVEGKTALELTEKVAKVETSGEGELAFVISINGREADSNKNEFWELVINGEPAQVGAGSYEIKDGDKIEWRISTF